ncbi:hypothetical protein TNCV_2195731 [Trichonephila clavipes]|nr:hypothetical protein TNCV_2195731 [Trichonephila clavipes]
MSKPVPTLKANDQARFVSGEKLLRFPTKNQWLRIPNLRNCKRSPSATTTDRHVAYCFGSILLFSPPHIDSASIIYSPCQG